MIRASLFVGLILTLSLSAQAQTFSSGSTGADGPLDLSTVTCPSTLFGCQVQLPESGILNYTTVNIPSGKSVSFKSNLRNTPVIILAQGAVTISGTIYISNGLSLNGLFFNPQVPGPGGFSGGEPGQNGFGPGGGDSNDTNARWIGPLSLVPIVGGSGGSGSNNSNGGGGGGAIVIASSESITISGRISATSEGGFGGHGSGGAIRLVANSISVAGQLNAAAQDPGHPGIIRLEAPAGSLSFTGTSIPTAILSTTINSSIVADNSTPALTITTIGGFAVPAYTTARPDVVDLLLPSQLTDPISVVVQGHNIAIGTQVNVNVSGSANATITSGTLSGTLDSSSATLSVTGLSRAAVSTLFVYAIFDAPTNMSAFNPKGHDHIAKVRIEASPGRKPQFAFLRGNGTEIEARRISPRVLAHFGTIAR